MRFSAKLDEKCLRVTLPGRKSEDSKPFRIRGPRQACCEEGPPVLRVSSFRRCSSEMIDNQRSPPTLPHRLAGPSPWQQPLKGAVEAYSVTATVVGKNSDPAHRERQGGPSPPPAR